MFEYVKKKEWQPVRLQLEKIIEKVHTYMRSKRSFSLYLEAVNNIYNQLPDDDWDQGEK